MWLVVTFASCLLLLLLLRQIHGSLIIIQRRPPTTATVTSYYYYYYRGRGGGGTIRHRDGFPFSTSSSNRRRRRWLPPPSSLSSSSKFLHDIIPARSVGAKSVAPLMMSRRTNLNSSDVDDDVDDDKRPSREENASSNETLEMKESSFSDLDNGGDVVAVVEEEEDGNNNRNLNATTSITEKEKEKEKEKNNPALHELEHRVKHATAMEGSKMLVENLASLTERSVAERALERAAAEKIGKEVIERTGERAFEAGERLVERSGESSIVRAFFSRLGAAKNAERLGEEVIERTGERAAAIIERRLIMRRLGRGALVAVPILGGIFAFYVLRTDLARAREERSKLRIETQQSKSNQLVWLVFAGAALADGIDTISHFVIAFTLLTKALSHHYLKVVETVSLACAIASTAFAVGGEILSNIISKSNVPVAVSEPEKASESTTTTEEL